MQCTRPQFNPWVGKIPWRRDRLLTPVFLGFPGGSSGKETACNVGDLGLIPGLGRYHAEGKGDPLQYSGLENSKDCIVHGVAKSQAQLNDFHVQLSEQCKNKKYPMILTVELLNILWWNLLLGKCERWNLIERHNFV